MATAKSSSAHKKFIRDLLAPAVKKQMIGMGLPVIFIAINAFVSGCLGTTEMLGTRVFTIANQTWYHMSSEIINVLFGTIIAYYVINGIFIDAVDEKKKAINAFDGIQYAGPMVTALFAIFMGMWTFVSAFMLWDNLAAANMKEFDNFANSTVDSVTVTWLHTYTRMTGVAVVSVVNAIITFVLATVSIIMIKYPTINPRVLNLKPSTRQLTNKSKPSRSDSEDEAASDDDNEDSD